MEILDRARQGDVLFIKTRKSEFKSKRFESHKVNKLTVALGEVTGHHHTMFGLGNTEVLECVEEGQEITKREESNDKLAMFFEVRGGEAVVRHEEHDAVTLGETAEDEVWIRVIQVEHDPFENTLRRVMD